MPLHRNFEFIDHAVDRFLAKASRRNEPLEAYRNQDEFKNFKNATEKIIADQFKWAAAHLEDMGIGADDLKAHQLEAKIGTYLERHMPTFKNSMDRSIVFDNLKAAFEWSVKAQYERMGVKIINKAADGPDYSTDFELTNQEYIDALNDDTNYLLTTKSTSYDATTEKRLINIVRDGRLNLDTYDEISSDILDKVDGISSVRSFMIANTETANAFGTADQAFLTENDIAQKEWVTAGSTPCVICEANENEGPIPSGDSFDSGDDHEPAHPNCECYTKGVIEDLSSMSQEQLDSLILWDGS